MIVRSLFLSCALAMAAPAYAADKTCSSLAKLKAELKDGVTVTALTPGQFNFLRGFYMGVPPTLEGKIPGTGAVLFEHKGDKGGIILWTTGSLACQPMPVPNEFIDALRQSKTGALDPDGREL